MPPRLIRIAFVALLLASSPAWSARADAPVRGGSPLDLNPTTCGAYTELELEALDEALWAANLTREDLEFRKDYAQGLYGLPMVREVLERPLGIAPLTDTLAAEALALPEAATMADWLRPAAALLPLTPEVDPEEPVFLDEVLDGADPFRLEAPTDLEGLIRSCRALTEAAAAWELTGPDLDRLRHFLPSLSAWHDVLESPYEPEQQEAWEAELEEAVEEGLLTRQAAELPLDELIRGAVRLLPEPRTWLGAMPLEAYPAEAPVILESPAGRIGIGTTGDDVWTGSFALLIEPGGDDRYLECRLAGAEGTPGRRWGFAVDLGGSDRYECGGVNLTLGAAVLGVAAFHDLGAGSDCYRSGHFSLGAAAGGIALFHDDGGSDSYEGRVFTQGAGAYGIALMVDGSVQDAPEVPTDQETPDPVPIDGFDHDRYHAWSSAQGFARVRSVAICVNQRGNEIYHAGGVYLHAPLFRDRYQSFAQGFSIGDRGSDHAGGIALLADGDGNDRYLGDIYNQGVGYWYGAGLLWDGGGNDTYEMTQYGQGSGIHLAVGGLIDQAGEDSYVMHSGLGQGGSHDWAASVLMDRGGGDRYMGTTSCNGAGLTNSVGLFFDRAGNDLYAGRAAGGINFGRPARDAPSIGVLVDTGGQDRYLGEMEDDRIWVQGRFGVGSDREPPPLPESARDEPGPTEAAVELPEVLREGGSLDQERFDRLWELACRWEVGDNRVIVPAAREALLAHGRRVLPYLERVLDQGGGLEMRAHQALLEPLRERYPRRVRRLLRRALEGGEPDRARVALSLIGGLDVQDLGSRATEFLTDPELRGAAIRCLTELGSDAGNETLRGFLAEESSEALLQTAARGLIASGADCYGDVRPLLDHSLVSLRDSVAELLARDWERFGPALAGDLGPELSPRALRSRLRILDLRAVPPEAGIRPLLMELLGHDDWGVRADAVRLLRRWLEAEPVPDEQAARAELAEHLAELGRKDPNSLVRSTAGP